jgi:hypothetical protein
MDFTGAMDAGDEYAFDIRSGHDAEVLALRPEARACCRGRN